MTTLHEAAAQGNLERLVSLLESSKAADPEFNIDQPDGRGRTALSHAASRGHPHVVQFLLEQGAEVNAQDKKGRTALWHAAQSHASVSRQQRIATVEALLEKEANPNIPASDDDSTALSKFVEHREPAAIKLLRHYGASTKHQVKKGSEPMSVEDLARATRDPSVIDAIVLEPGQASSNDGVVVEVVHYVLRSIGYMNQRFGGVISRFFGIGGNMYAPLRTDGMHASPKVGDIHALELKAHVWCISCILIQMIWQFVPGEQDGSDSDSGIDLPHEESRAEAPPSRIYGNSGTDASLGLGDVGDFATLAIGRDEDDDEDDAHDVPLVSEISAKTTPAQFHAGMMRFIDDTGLGYFFAEGDKFLENVAVKAAELEGREDEVLNSKEDVQDITKLALYQPVFYCDDSTSMKSGTRARDQTDLVRRVARISTLLVPDGCGTGLQFINKKRALDDNLKAEQVEEIMRSVTPRGNTKIGTNLKRKILDPLLYDVVNKGEKLHRPLLVSCITDGCATGEPSSEFRDTIVSCVDFLEKHDYPRTTVRFQISQIGNDSGAESFLNQLRDDPDLKDVLFCTTKRLDEEYKKLHENEEDLERWLLQTLMEPILSFGRN
ncbi:Putative ankyrin repeat domain-containing protein [Trichoderma ghanense]|uniref:Ankyrin repeat domain-containing protein n=1 Tax=Trichoderma ghanense TaxID=65468 RepID=A0ABY2H8J2_9HYPO